MSKSLFTLVLAGIYFATANGLLLADPTCPKCEIIREDNKKKVNKYEYYEDYLKANPQQQSSNDNQENSSDDQTPPPPKPQKSNASNKKAPTRPSSGM